MAVCFWALFLSAVLSATVDSVTGTNTTPEGKPPSSPTAGNLSQGGTSVDIPKDHTEENGSHNEETLQTEESSDQPTNPEADTEDEEAVSDDEYEESSDDQDPGSTGGNIGPVATPLPDDETSAVAPEQSSFSSQTATPTSNAWSESNGPTRHFSREGWTPVGASPTGDIIVLAKTPGATAIYPPLTKVASPAALSNLPTESNAQRRDPSATSNTRVRPVVHHQHTTNGQRPNPGGKFPSVTSTKYSFPQSIFRYIPMPPPKLPLTHQAVNEFHSIQSQIDSFPVAPRPLPPSYHQPPLRNWILQRKIPSAAPVPASVPRLNNSKPIHKAPVVNADKMKPQVPFFGGQPSNVPVINGIFRFPDAPGFWMPKVNGLIPMLPQQHLWHPGSFPLKNQNFFSPVPNAVRQEQIPSPETAVKMPNHPSGPPPSSDFWVVRDNDLNAKPTCVIYPPVFDFPLVYPKADNLQIGNDGLPPSKQLQQGTPPPFPLLVKYISPYPFPTPIEYAKPPSEVTNGSSLPQIPFGTNQNAPFLPPQAYYIPSQTGSFYPLPVRSSSQLFSSQISGFPLRYVMNDPLPSGRYYAPPQPAYTFAKNTSGIPNYPFPVFVPPSQPYLYPFPQQKPSPYVLPYMTSFTTSVHDILGIGGIPYVVKGPAESPRPPSSKTDTPQRKSGSGTSGQSTKDFVGSSGVRSPNPSPAQSTEPSDGENVVITGTPPSTYGKFPPSFQYPYYPLSKVSVYSTGGGKPYSFAYSQRDGLETLQRPMK